MSREKAVTIVPVRQVRGARLEARLYAIWLHNEPLIELKNTLIMGRAGMYILYDRQCLGQRGGKLTHWKKSKIEQNVWWLVIEACTECCCCTTVCCSFFRDVVTYHTLIPVHR